MVRVIRLHPEGDNDSLILNMEPAAIDASIGQVRSAIEASAPGDNWVVEIDEMTLESFASLEEHTGW